MEAESFPKEVVKGIADSLDCNPVFRGNVVSPSAMMLIMLVTILVLGGIYFMMTSLPERH
ncbi:MAG: hypothetical protein ACI4D7_05080 [Lachnospiraceae bacterium]